MGAHRYVKDLMILGEAGVMVPQIIHPSLLCPTLACLKSIMNESHEEVCSKAHPEDGHNDAETFSNTHKSKSTFPCTHLILSVLQFNSTLRYHDCGPTIETVNHALVEKQGWLARPRDVKSRCVPFYIQTLGILRLYCIHARKKRRKLTYLYCIHYDHGLWGLMIVATGL